MAGITVPIISTADTAGIKKFESQFTAMSKKLKKQKSGFDELSSSIKKAFTVGAIIEIGKKALDEAQQSYAVSQLTATVIKNTGAAAYTSVGQVHALAMSLSNLTGVDDEVIQAGSNVLLSFQNIRNAGKGAAAIFDRATTASVDLSKAMGIDAPKAAKLLGKALADPVKGQTALRKAGVLLTNEQQAQIKAMQKRGDLLGAQEIVLAAVEGRFKGVAAAVASPMEKLQTTLNNLLETIGTPLLESLNPILQSLAPIFEQLSPVLEQLGKALAPVLTALGEVLAPVLQIILAVITPLLPAISSLGVIIGALAPVLTAVTPLFKVLGYVLGVVVSAAIGTVAALMDVMIRQLQFLFKGLAMIPRYGARFKPAVDAMQKVIDQLDTVVHKSFTLPKVGDGLAAMTDNFNKSAVNLKAGAKATIEAGKDFAKGAKVSKKVAAPRTKRITPTTKTGDQSFTVAGSGGGLSLSVTVNGSVIQERDIARTIRNEIIQLTRRQGMTPNFGV